MEPMLATKSWTDTFVALPEKYKNIWVFDHSWPLCQVSSIWTIEKWVIVPPKHIWLVSIAHKKSRNAGAKFLFNVKNFLAPQSKSSYVANKGGEDLHLIHFYHFFLLCNSIIAHVSNYLHVFLKMYPCQVFPAIFKSPFIDSLSALCEHICLRVSSRKMAQILEWH